MQEGGAPLPLPPLPLPPPCRLGSGDDAAAAAAAAPGGSLVGNGEPPGAPGVEEEAEVLAALLRVCFFWQLGGKGRQFFLFET
jgi:hypothetical protein